MCALIGSAKKSMYDVLMDVNAERGMFAYSHCVITNSKPQIHIQRFNRVMSSDDIKDLPCNMYYLGHFQAPTSCARSWKAETSHPFESGDWIVAHNGVISNFEELKEKYTIDPTVVVDTHIIPILLARRSAENGSEQLSEQIAAILSQLQGTFALWIVNSKTRQIFIARQGSTLWANPLTGSFSSVECKSNGWFEIPEGFIYELQLKTNQFVPTAKFQTSSPFLFL